ncbi:MAG TPA: hypothetical protein DEG69_04920 [Flavobacteriaceae bacterium]|nr:hypothetical protein [Flavobacteriaceae bacterium]
MSKIDEAKIKEYVVFQFQRNIVNFYKNQVNIIEDLKSDHRQFINKLCTIAPKEHVKNMDYFDVDKYNYIRKKVLDGGNEIVREFEKAFSHLEVNIKEKGKNE